MVTKDHPTGVTDAEKAKDAASKARDAATKAKGAASKAKERTKRGTEQQTDSLRGQLGQMVFDFAEDTFPETAKRRQRSGLKVTFVVGLAVGILVRHALGMERRR